jgi:insertion element IS1 protein InsB
MGITRGNLKTIVKSSGVTTKNEGMWKIERKHLTLRTRIKRLARKTICFLKNDTDARHRSWLIC